MQYVFRNIWSSFKADPSPDSVKREDDAFLVKDLSTSDDAAANGRSQRILYVHILLRSTTSRARVVGPACRASAKEVKIDICDRLGMQRTAWEKPSSVRDESKLVSSQLQSSGLDS